VEFYREDKKILRVQQLNFGFVQLLIDLTQKFTDAYYIK